MLGKYIQKKNRLSPAQFIVLGFAGIILLGALLLNLPIASQDGKSVGFINALFTSTSAVCVTGLVAVDTGTYWTTFGKVIIITLIQVGGLGFMSIATLFAMLIGKKIYLHQRLLIQEALNQYDLSGLVRLTRHILIGTFIIEGIGAIILSMVFIPEMGFLKGLGYGAFHSISAFCNAGFDLMGNFSSLTSYTENIVVNIVIMTLIILGGLGFSVMFDIIKKKNFSKLSLHSKIVIVMSSFLILSGFVLFFAMEYSNPKTLGNLSFKGKILGALFQSVTTRTAGFNTIDLAAMKDSSKFLTIIFMFIGGSPASTAGGIKTSTIGVLILAVITFIRGKEDVEAFGRRISYSVVNKSLGVIAIGLSVVIFMTITLSLTEIKFNFLDTLFESVSAFGTVGLSLAGSPNLSLIGKILIALSMFAGRVGALTILFALSNRKQKNLIKYPEDKVIVG
ncbi:TrkH family potassium uptake protein [Tepidibacter formicigenes]|jgi:trk system potassium uptake protein TrkH|uniref:Trk system potassium uptake protein TrkH n=1 Tax=Tepidibacter formicigenes DSM 15518 TaxID=1123349 RepID=A0A1M6KQG9_9FIRM|nr:TrkH family potassium uptake protein [Tepidibacter formicigenes]SHJ61223.1 trk system potassium uptake protein TrkH [Tepidibacter formicigenes DSM 15518]